LILKLSAQGLCRAVFATATATSSNAAHSSKPDPDAGAWVWGWADPFLFGSTQTTDGRSTLYSNSEGINMNIRIYLPLALLFAFVCQPLVSVEQTLPAHSLVIPEACNPIFPKLLETLVANDCIILAANQHLGVISFRSQFEDNTNSARKRVNVLEGTLLLRPETPTSTLVRVKLTLSCQDTYTTQGTYRVGIQRDADPGWYKGILEMIAKAGPSPTK
jgi:hypothetical protein